MRRDERANRIVRAGNIVGAGHVVELGNAVADPVIRVTGLPAGLSRAQGTEIAATVRAAYAAYDPYPGLPVSDGAAETTDQVLADAAAGARFWEARAGQRLVGTLRVHPGGPGVWTIGRIAVALGWRSRGLVRALIDDVDAAAVAAGVRRIELVAVVERQLPARYASLGFTTVRRAPAADKPLTEVTMARRPGTARLPVPEGAPEPGAGLVLRWFATAGGTVALPGSPRHLGPDAGPPDGDAVLVGADIWSTSTGQGWAAASSAFVRDGARSLPGGGFGWRRPPIFLIGYRMPRLIAPALLALWREWPDGRPWREGATHPGPGALGAVAR